MIAQAAYRQALLERPGVIVRLNWEWPRFEERLP